MGNGNCKGEGEGTGNCKKNSASTPRTAPCTLSPTETSPSRYHKLPVIVAATNRDG